MTIRGTRPPVEREAEKPPTVPEVVFDRLLRVLAALSAAGLVASVLFLEIVHAGDRFFVGYVQGTRMALAKYLNEGILYPPLFDGGRFGGTRFMPLPTLLHAGAARVTGEYLLSGKLVGYLSTAFLLAVLYALLRKAGCGRAVSLLLTTAVLATIPGLFAAMSIQGDALPVAWQLLAMGLVARSTRRGSVLGSSALCVLAVLSKVTALWAPAAIFIWLLRRDRRHAAWFVGAFALLLGLSAAALQLASHGEFLTNMVEVSFAGVGGAGAMFRAPARALNLILDSGPVVVVFALLALYRIATSARSGLNLSSVAFLFGLVALIGMAADRGVVENHVIDVAVLSALVVGELVADGEQRSDLIPALVIGLAIAMAGVFFAWRIGPEVRAGVDDVRGETPPGLAVEPLSGVVRPADRILAEDPYVPVARGELPVVLDAWVLLRLEPDHPGWIRRLADRIDRREFDRIVLVRNVNSRVWYSEIHFGDTMANAIRTNYRLSLVRSGYFVYVPRS